jgi:riboflavin biosynthesis pyrimidine reductase
MNISTLFEHGEDGQESGLPEIWRGAYDGNLLFSDSPAGRPLVIGNFVQTLDGVVSFNIPGQSGGGEISGRNEEDTFIMALLRSYADAVVIGEGTFRAAPGHRWTAEFIYPKLKNEFAALRAELGKSSRHPLHVIVSGSGTVNLHEPLFRHKEIASVVFTTAQGESRLKARYGPALPPTVHVLPGGPIIAARDIVSALHVRYGVRLLLHEGGPTLFAAFLEQRLIDELFLTIAPQIAGTGLVNQRPSFSGPLAFAPDTAMWGTLLSAKRATASGHLFLRYRLPSVG